MKLFVLENIKNCEVCDYSSDCETKSDLIKIVNSGKNKKEKRKKIAEVFGNQWLANNLEMLCVNPNKLIEIL